MKHFSFYHLVLLIALVVPASLLSQTIPSSSGIRPRIGLYGGVNINEHSANFSGLPGTPSCCPEYQSGSGLGPTFGLLYELPLTSQILLSLRGGFASTGGTLTANELTTVESNGVAVPMNIQHSIALTKTEIGVTGLFGWRLSDQLYAIGGLNAGYVLTASFFQKEQLSDETLQGTFENGSRIRHEFTGDVPNAASIQTAVQAGIGYELPLNREGSLLAVPEVTFSYALIPVTSEVPWKTHTVRAGIALKYSPVQHLNPPNLPPNNPDVPPQPPTPEIVASVTAHGLNKSGVESNVVQLEVEEFTSTDRRPLLNYIFFESASAEIPDRYQRISEDQTEKFETDNLYGLGKLSDHYQLLNIIGSRLRTMPNSSVRLIGTNANVGEETNNRALSLQRAESIRNYLHEIWGIDEKRLIVESRDLPSVASNATDADGQAENRRVEIVADNPAIVEPILLHDTVRQPTPPVVRFRPTVNSELGIRQWRVSVMQDGHILKRISGEGAIPEYIDWQVDLEKESIPRAPGQMFYTLQIEDETGKITETSPEAIRVEQITIYNKRRERLADVEVERYGLILFDFDQATLNDRHLAILKDIAKRVRPEATVVVRGYTDRTGDPARNQVLALDRAKKVAAQLDLPESQITVESSSTPPYDNAFPEGRFYSRTVIIEVRNPIREGDSG
ncbi:MAG: OmpA family protein [Ignavibacteriae bacterium]|nr:OmpA family protein [Ignavibacteriota bacterium]MCB9217765.1 OmpA family protein [Ignavibacteria bacterium]